VRVFEGDGEAQTLPVDPGLGLLLAAEHTTIGEGGTDRPALLDARQRCWMAVPLMAREEPLGLLLLAAGDSRAYDHGRADLATALVGQAMVAYENARLFAQVQHLATVDDLTGVANRRHFFELAARELARARRHGRGLAAMMIDIDNFKRVNDRHGHQVGDDVIRTVARRLDRFARSYDVLGRYGGEEFALLLWTDDPGPNGEPSPDQDTTADPEPRQAAERLRASIGDVPIPVRTGSLTVTVSIGVAMLEPGDEVIGDLLARADRRLYEAKNAGRNRVSTS
jgi:PleD family two-component response regulator